MDTWKAEGLIDDDHNFTPPMNMTRVEVLRRLFPFEDPIFKTEFLGAFLRQGGWSADSQGDHNYRGPVDGCSSTL